MHLARVTGWFPWIPYDARDFAQSPYDSCQVEIARTEWDVPQIVAPRALDPRTNVVDLWWRPVSQDAQAQAGETARARRAADTDHAAFLAYAVWFRYTYPTVPCAPLSAWQWLSTHPEGRRVQAMWTDIVHAVNDARTAR